MIEHLVPYAQYFGFLGAGFAISKQQLSHAQKIRTLTVIELSVFAFHFYLLNKPTAMMMGLIGVSRSLLFIKLSSLKARAFIMILLGIFAIIFGVYTSENIYDWLPIIAMLIASSAEANNNTVKVKSLYLINYLLWVAYAIIISSYGVIISAGFSSLSCVIGIYRDSRKTRRA